MSRLRSKNAPLHELRLAIRKGFIETRKIAYLDAGYEWSDKTCQSWSFG
jgi:hypothetical protein